MSIFPSNPEVGDEFSGKRWNGTVWEVIGVDLSRDYATISYVNSSDSAVSASANSYTDSAISSFEPLPEIFYENSKTVTSNYTITSNKNAMSAGPITIDTGITVTIPEGSTWNII